MTICLCLLPIFSTLLALYVVSKKHSFLFVWYKFKVWVATDIWVARTFNFWPHAHRTHVCVLAKIQVSSIICWSEAEHICPFLSLKRNILSVLNEVHIFWEGHKILRNLPLTLDYSTSGQAKVRGRFRKILWPSQNIWTLKIPLKNWIGLASTYHWFSFHNF